jgi:hypothetical protein
MDAGPQRRFERDRLDRAPAVRSATPAFWAMVPAFCGGMMLATAALWRAKSVTTVSEAGSTAVTLPP